MAILFLRRRRELSSHEHCLGPFGENKKQFWQNTHKARRQRRAKKPSWPLPLWCMRTCTNHTQHTIKVGQNHIYIRYIHGIFWQGSHQIYGHYGVFTQFWPTLLTIYCVCICVCVCVCVHIPLHLKWPYLGPHL